jgi:hypothetical protein
MLGAFHETRSRLLAKAKKRSTKKTRVNIRKKKPVEIDLCESEESVDSHEGENEDFNEIDLEESEDDMDPSEEDGSVSLSFHLPG